MTTSKKQCPVHHCWGEVGWGSVHGAVATGSQDNVSGQAEPDPLPGACYQAESTPQQRLVSLSLPLPPPPTLETCARLSPPRDPCQTELALLGAPWHVGDCCRSSEQGRNRPRST